MEYLIGIDVGTSATKTVLFDKKGNIIASASREYPLYQPHNGWAEQKPEDWRDAVIATVEDVVKKAGAGKDEVKGIGISGQMHGLVMLDEAGNVTRPSIIWCDQRTGEEVEEMLEIMPRERWIEITANPPLTGWTAAKILWVRNHEPENYERCRLFSAKSMSPARLRERFCRILRTRRDFPQRQRWWAAPVTMRLRQSVPES